ncbi:hypothetical protein B0T10DRAFT_172355 [Thelonectria olida]|uniref:Uncharacterized protein n=1 Tax=Thelonectria olida TaxID=1576542 RepID=A0A9P9AUV0_9HYPO|nr:hypothetical protein B0T10DRAFT_172355 [Thelonectria olida]
MEIRAKLRGSCFRGGRLTFSLGHPLSSFVRIGCMLRVRCVFVPQACLSSITLASSPRYVSAHLTHKSVARVKTRSRNECVLAHRLARQEPQESLIPLISGVVTVDPDAIQDQPQSNDWHITQEKERKKVGQRVRCSHVGPEMVSAAKGFVRMSPQRIPILNPSYPIRTDVCREEF